MSIVKLDNPNSLKSIDWNPLPSFRPLLMIGHGTRDISGKKTFLEFAYAYQSLDYSRPVIPCFLELTGSKISGREK